MDWRSGEIGDLGMPGYERESRLKSPVDGKSFAQFPACKGPIQPRAYRPAGAYTCFRRDKKTFQSSTRLCNTHKSCWRDPPGYRCSGYTGTGKDRDKHLPGRADRNLFGDSHLWHAVQSNFPVWADRWSMKAPLPCHACSARGDRRSILPSARSEQERYWILEAIRL